MIVADVLTVASVGTDLRLLQIMLKANKHWNKMSTSPKNQKQTEENPHSRIIKSLLEEVVKPLPKRHVQTDKILGQKEIKYNKKGI